MLPSVYDALAPGGYFMHEGPIGGHSLSDPAPLIDVAATLGHNHKQAWFDACRVLVASGHFRLVTDVRYKTSYNMLSSLDGKQHHRFSAQGSAALYTAGGSWRLPRLRRGKWRDAVTSDCLVQKATDVAKGAFTDDLRKIRPPWSL